VCNAILHAVEADKWEASRAAFKEIADRLEGKAVQRSVAEVTISIEERREISVTAYLLFYENQPS
jgi:hypothetical protein